MVPPVQFQLGLELTNIVNPITQAMTALGSLAMIDAIKKSGSDFITETKLASLIGRHRIDPVIKFHFQEMVAKSDQSVVSRYLDIILESGSGPTVREALKNPALFSMVIQLSGLAFAHEDESLANAVVEAIERIVQESGADVGIVPDYVSLLGTIRACQQQTAAFRWTLLYEAVEDKIQKTLAGPDDSSASDEREPLDYSLKKLPNCVRIRALPISVLQGLFMWLRSLQSFNEHRLLHLRCNTGISTIVVWCHYILGLSLVVNVQGTETCLGDAPHNLVVEESLVQEAGVVLMDPLNPQEPLFTLQSDEHGIGDSYEHRAEAYGYGAKYLQRATLSLAEVQRGAEWVLWYSVQKCGTHASDPDADAFGARYPSEDELLSAGRFLFALDQLTIPCSDERTDLDKAMVNRPYQWLTLVAILVSFARVPVDDLARCSAMPLALDAIDILPHDENAKLDHKNAEGYLNLLESFKILSFLLLGRHMGHDDYVKPALLVSAWGWSVFLDSIDPGDPFDVPVDTLRVLRGVPSRRGLRRTRIIDGPQSSPLPSTFLYCDNGHAHIYVAPGVSTAQKGTILVGHHSDAFQVTQQFTFNNTRTLRYGLRKMTEMSVRTSRLPPCQCDKPKHEFLTLRSMLISSSVRKIAAIDALLEAKDDLVQKVGPLTNYLEFKDSERVFASKHGSRYFVYVTENPAARWLQLETLYTHYGLKDPETGEGEYCIGLGGRDTCVDCAVRNSERWPPKAVFLL